MALDGQVPVYFEHHVLLWKYPEHADRAASAQEGPQAPRCSAACRCCMLEAQSAGEIAFSRDAPGHIVALHLQPGDGIIVREHQFLAATAQRPVRLQPHPGVRQHDVRRRLLGRPVLRRRSRGRRLGPRLRQRVREGARAGGDDRHRARRLAVPRPLGADGAGGLRVQDRLARRRRRQPRLQPLHRSRDASASRAPTSTRRCQETASSGNQQQSRRRSWSAGSSAACSTTSATDRELRPGISPSIRCRRESSARSGSAATSCWSTSPASARAARVRRRSCSSRPNPTRRCPTPAPRSRCTSTRLKNERRGVAPFTQLAAQLGYLRLSGYRLALERRGLRSKINVVNPATGAIVGDDPRQAPGRAAVVGGGGGATQLLATVTRAAAGRPAARPRRTPSCCVRCCSRSRCATRSLGGAEAAELADRALELTRGDAALDPPAALEAAKAGLAGSQPSLSARNGLRSERHDRLRRGRNGAEGARTPDLRAASATLSQLSYSPFEIEVVSKVNTCALVVGRRHDRQMNRPARNLRV